MKKNWIDNNVEISLLKKYPQLRGKNNTCNKFLFKNWNNHKNSAQIDNDLKISKIKN